MLKSPSNAQEIRLPRPEQHNSRAQSPATMDALKTSFLPNLSMDPALVSNTHFCPMCGQQFESPQQTTEHMHLCHGGLSVVAGVGGGSILLAPHHVSASMSDSMKIDYPCHSCDEKFANEQDLDDHHRLVHQAPAFLARCPACSFYGISPAALQGANEYKCIHCGSVCTPSALAASQPGYEPQTPEHMPTMAPHDMKLSNHELLQRQYQEQVSILQQHQEQQEQQQQQQQQQHLQQQEHLQQQQQQHQDQQQHHQSHHQPQQQPDDNSPHESVQLKVPPLTVKLNKSVNGTATVIHPHVIIKEEPLNGDGMDGGSPTSVPVYTIQQNPGAATSVVVSSSHDHSAAVLSNQASTITTTAIVGGVPKVRHKCPDCPKTFKTPGTLAMHRKVHTGEADLTPKERPYTCSYCGKSFTQSNTLKQHTRIHTGEKPFQCTYCEKAFSVKDYLTKHIRTHTGEKPYTCPYCEKRFTQRSALTVHTTKLHPL
ncbi:chorion transcription factor Cf2 isoform X3 [Musca vetustissima]|uniref:chorion transcription factor Cf2 isoform X3 n=1 Tax=Musca vetustissima TaxID=27455 RepID=UPI002AB67348|nr:chorion transcription factor Cf2 isoform X3 [Musca vetustissima]